MWSTPARWTKINWPEFLAGAYKFCYVYRRMEMLVCLKAYELEYNNRAMVHAKRKEKAC